MEFDTLIAFAGMLLAGFAWISSKLEKINRTLSNAVTHEQCSVRREKCPCVKELEKLERKIEQ